MTKLNCSYIIKMGALALSAALLLISCTEEDLPMISSDIPVAFAAGSDWNELQPATRSDATGFETNATIGVFGYYMPGGTTDVTNKTPDFMYNEEVTKQADGSWTYTPLKYWPADQSDKIHFVGYTPMASASNRISISSNTQKGYPVISYTIGDAKTDLLASVPVSANKENNPVILEFQHILGQVNVKIKAADDFKWVDDESIKITSVTLKSINENGSFDFVEWTTSNPKDLIISSGTVFSGSTNVGNVLNGFPVYLLPTSLSELQIVIETTINGTVITETVNCTLESVLSVTPGKNHIITVILNRDMSGFSATADWIRSDSQEVIFDGNEINHHKN